MVTVCPPALSVAVTLTLTAPRSALSGVPEKDRVAALKTNQLGNAEPSARVTL